MTCKIVIVSRENIHKFEFSWERKFLASFTALPFDHQGGKQGKILSFSQRIIRCENKKLWLSFSASSPAFS